MKRICKNAVINYEDSDKELIDELSIYLDSQAQKVYEFFEIEKPKEKVVINIISTKKEYDEIFKAKTGFNANYSSRGSLLPDQTILYLSINDYKNSLHAFSPDKFHQAVSEYKKTLVHEFAHWVNLLFNKKHNCSMTARYLVEGIAVYLSRQKDDKQIDFNFSLENILDRNRDCYNGYYLVTKYFVENYNKTFVLQMFESSRQANELLIKELFDKAKQFYNQNENF